MKEKGFNYHADQNRGLNFEKTYRILADYFEKKQKTTDQLLAMFGFLAKTDATPITHPKFPWEFICEAARGNKFLYQKAVLWRRDFLLLHVDQQGAPSCPKKKI